MKATKFMRIPFFVAGYEVTLDNMDAIATWCQGNVIRDAERPFVRVPVDRATNKKQTEAYVGTWVIVSVRRGELSFKVYTDEWLRKQFVEMPEDMGTPSILQDIEIEDDDEDLVPEIPPTATCTHVAPAPVAIPKQKKNVRFRAAT